MGMNLVQTKIIKLYEAIEEEGGGGGHSSASGGVSTWTDKGFFFDFHWPSFSIVQI